MTTHLVHLSLFSSFVSGLASSVHLADKQCHLQLATCHRVSTRVSTKTETDDGSNSIITNYVLVRRTNIGDLRRNQGIGETKVTCHMLPFSTLTSKDRVSSRQQPTMLYTSIPFFYLVYRFFTPTQESPKLTST